MLQWSAEEDTQAMPQHFAQLSDPHLSGLEDINPADLFNKRALGYLSWRRKRRFEHRREVLDALQHDLEHNAPEQLLITGDLTHIGLPLEFEQARDWLQQMGDPSQIALVPGNHDACAAAPWDKTFALWEAYMAGDENTPQSGEHTSFPSLRIRGEIAFIGLSTACPKPPLMATGTVGAAQLSQLPALLKSAGDQGLFRVVYLHHCPIVGREKWRKRLTDADKLQAILQKHGAELVLHGHGHRAHYSELPTQQGNLPVIAVPSASALGLHGADIAHYNRYAVHRTDQGWQLHIAMRGFEPGLGEFREDQEKTVELRR
jgi:3',5'-cyclic AMP phosphodiesterase CpdA|tara:strand:- start:42067 stop:43017 length:951 start_codon:yes stop_codon:yes gene_type:complete